MEACERRIMLRKRKVGRQADRKCLKQLPSDHTSLIPFTASPPDIIYRQTLVLDGVKVNLEIVDISTRPVRLSSKHVYSLQHLG